MRERERGNYETLSGEFIKAKKKNAAMRKGVRTTRRKESRKSRQEDNKKKKNIYVMV